MNSTRIIVTGSSGFIGSSVVNYFSKKGYSVNTIVRSRSIDNQIRILQSANNSDKRENILIHCASATPVNSPLDTIFRDNTRLIYELSAADDLHKLFSHIINLSSMSVYGDHSQEEVTETLLPIKLSPYGASKLAAEEILTSHCIFSGIDCLHLRLPGVVGPKSYVHSRNLVSTIKYNCEHGIPLRLANPQSQFNNIVHISSLLSTLEMVCSKHLAGIRIINLASLDAICLEEVVSTILASVNSSSTVSWIHSRSKPFTISTTRAADSGFPLLTTRESLRRFCSDRG
jgi:nucleoside-diphosphate-sugar epimerase